MNRVTNKICRSEKNQGHKGHRKVKFELNQGLNIIKPVYEAECAMNCQI